MKKRLLIVVIFALLWLNSVYSQPCLDCCNNQSYRETAHNLAVRISGLVSFVGKCSDNATNENTLNQLKIDRPSVYEDFVKTGYAIIDFIEKKHQDTCLMKALPEDKAENIYDWLIYLKDLVETPTFPSTEFCTGCKARIELGQGAANILTKSAAYLGTLRGYLVYTIGKKANCGNRFRVMIGPAFWLQSNTFYATLSGRLNYRIKDIAPKPFSIGNINTWVEYTTSFNNFNFASLGFEVELGPWGFNLSINQNFKTNRPGFLVGIILFTNNFN